MIKARELRIGNYVDLGNRIAKIAEIYQKGVLVYDLEETQDTIEEIDRLKPIPLSEEWLLKLGFEYYEPLGHYRIVHGEIWASVTKDFRFSIVNLAFDEAWRLYPIVIKCVHQLQNIYFSLTNTEL